MDVVGRPDDAAFLAILTQGMLLEVSQTCFAPAVVVTATGCAETIDQQLQRGGVRLATILNDVFQ